MPMALLLDGSMGHELKQRGVVRSFQDAMLANRDLADVVTAVHADYVAAGCDVLTTNTFTLTPEALADVGREAELPSLLHAACECARQAAAGSSKTVLLAGSLPPLRHCYLRELCNSEADMVPLYTRIVQELAPRVDLFLAETLCCSAEARAALSAAAPSGKPCWLSLTLHDDVAASASQPPALRGGESVRELLSALTSRASGAPIVPKALLYNCCAPQVVTRALATQPTLPSAVERTGGYANGFESTTSEWLYREGAEMMGCTKEPHHFDSCPICAEDFAEGTLTPAAYCEHAQRWAANGASVIGGCCGIGPAHLRAVHTRWRQRKGPREKS